MARKTRLDTIYIRIRKVKGRRKGSFTFNLDARHWHHLTVPEAERGLRDGCLDLAGAVGVVRVKPVPARR